MKPKKPVGLVMKIGILIMLAYLSNMIQLRTKLIGKSYHSAMD